MQATHSTSSTTQLSQLPPALTAHILQFVPQQQRLSCCALVCSAWREAVAQATVHIDCQALSPAAADALVAWLEQHGQQVQSLELRFVEGSVVSHLELRLPWARLSHLQSIHLAFFQLPAISSSSSSSAAAAAAGSSTRGGGSSSGSDGQTSDLPLLPRLNQLHLQHCELHSLDSLLHLASSPGLTSLVVESLVRECTADQKALSTALLERLPQLVVLRLPGIRSSRAAIKHVAGMGSLQRLELAIDEESGYGDCLADLPSSLTRLYFYDVRLRALLYQQPTLPSQLQQLTSLQQLQLLTCSLSPAVLASIPQLRHLQLLGCILLPCDPNHRHNPAPTAALFGALQQLTLLQHLVLRCDQLATARPPPQQWAALTASTQLTHLCLKGFDQQPLPQGAAQHMFPAGRQLLRLQQLKLFVELLIQGEQLGWCLDGTDLGSIISCCPQLHDLNVDRTVPEGADVSALLQLPASCTSLAVGGVGFADAAASVVAQLTQLSELRWESSPQFTDAGLQQLTALQGLHSLYARGCNGISSSILNLQSSDAKGPVWQQLQAAVVAASQSA